MAKILQNTILRWILVLPGAFLCAFLASFPTHWFVMLVQALGNFGEDDIITIDGKSLISAIPPETLEILLYAGITPFTMIYFGSRIAPNRKFQTGIAISILWGVIFGAALTYTIINSYYEGWYWLLLVITIIFAITGVTLGLISAYKKVQEKDIA